jgi:hypothetical protein
VFVQNYYKILEVDYDATEEAIRSNYIRLALVCDFSIIVLLWFFLLRLCTRVRKKTKMKGRDRRRKGRGLTF